MDAQVCVRAELRERDLGYDLGTQLLARTTRNTRLTWVGKIFMKEAKRVLATLEQAKISGKAAGVGFRGLLWAAVSDNAASPQFASLLARCRQEEPDVRLRLFEAPLAHGYGFGNASRLNRYRPRR